MIQENVRACMQTLSSKLSSETLAMVKRKIENADDRIAEEIIFAKYDEPWMILIFSVLLGSLGVDRFILGDVGLGVCKLLFGWLTLGIWPLADIYFCYKKAQHRNLQRVMQILADHNIA